MKLALMMATLVGTGAVWASVTISGNTITFDVGENVTETYDEAIATDGSITQVVKKGLGTMRLTKEGGKSRTMTVRVQEGVLELVERNALASYNNIYISKGAQFYQHSAYASGEGYATICHYIKGVAGNGPDGKGAIRLDTTTNAKSCFRNEVTLTDDATFYMDNDQPAGFGTDCTLNLNGHTLTVDGEGTTLFSRKELGTTTLRVVPGAGGKIVINTPKMPEILNDVVFEGDASNALVVNKATMLNVSASAVFPWSVRSDNAESHEGSVGWLGLTEGSRILCGGVTAYGDAIQLGAAGASGKGASLVVKSGAVLRPANLSSPAEIRFIEEGPIPALFRIEAGATVSNKCVSTWGSVNRKIATQCWGNYAQVSSAYLANWNGRGFFGLEDGSLTLSAGTYLLGMPKSRGMFQQDGGTLSFGTECNMCAGGRSDYVMRGGTLAAGARFNLARECDPNYPNVDDPDDFISFSLVGPGNPVATFGNGVKLNSRTNVAVHVNLNAGRFSVALLTLQNGTARNASYLNFNGGTFVIPGNAGDYLTSEGWTPRMTTIYGNGATFEDNREKRFFLNNQGLNAKALFPLRGAHGRGIKSVRLPEGMPRSGYRGVVPVQVKNAAGDTTGSDAQAAVDFDVATGTVKDELVILCPGCDYTAAPKVIAYGPDYETPYECIVELTDDDQVPGPFVKTGVGELVLNMTNNTYAGPYVISNGTLMVNYNAEMPRESKIFAAGGCFRWDWRDRTIAEFGGWGTFFGSRNNSRNTLNVTDRFVVDAEDLNAGRVLAVDEKTDDGTSYAKDDCIRFGANCKVVVRRAEMLDPETKLFVLLHQDQTAINRIPELETDIPEMHLVLRNRGRDLCLKRKEGLSLIVR